MPTCNIFSLCIVCFFTPETSSSDADMNFTPGDSNVTMATNYRDSFPVAVGKNVTVIVLGITINYINATMVHTFNKNHVCILTKEKVNQLSKTVILWTIWMKMGTSHFFHFHSFLHALLPVVVVFLTHVRFILVEVTVFIKFFCLFCFVLDYIWRLRVYLNMKKGIKCKCRKNIYARTKKDGYSNFTNFVIL